MRSSRSNLLPHPRAVKHKHHIIPRHAGGTDVGSNLVELTVEEHAEAHRLLYEQYGRWQDKVAWMTLSGQMSRADAIRTAQQNADRSWAKTPEGKRALQTGWIKRKAKGIQPWNKGLTKHDTPALQEASQRNLKYRQQGRLSNIGEHNRGTTFSKKHRIALSVRAKQRSKQTCPNCEKSVIPQMYVRWHGDNCRQR